MQQQIAENNTETNSKKTQKTKNNNLTSKLALWLAILALTAIAANYYIFHSFQMISSSGKDHLQVTINKNATQLQNLVTQVKTLQDQVQKQQANLKTNDQGLHQLIKAKKATRRDWILAEAEHLIRLSILNLQFTRNIPAAITLLETADQNLKQLGDPALTKTRQLLANDIAALKAVPSIDQEGLLIQINALANQVNKLPIAAVSGTKDKTQTLVKEQKSNWKTNLKQSIKQIENIVIIRHQGDAIKPMLAPGQRVYLDQNIHLMLQQAQWALLQAQPKVYKTSLEQAKMWITQYFSTNVSSTKAMLKELSQLEVINVKPELPDVSDTLKALQEMNKERQGRA